jgi:hypothetical protein
MADNFDTNVARRKPNVARRPRPVHPWDVSLDDEYNEDRPDIADRANGDISQSDKQSDGSQIAAMHTHSDAEQQQQVEETATDSGIIIFIRHRTQ